MEIYLTADLVDSFCDDLRKKLISAAVSDNPVLLYIEKDYQYFNNPPLSLQLTLSIEL